VKSFNAIQIFKGKRPLETLALDQALRVATADQRLSDQWFPVKKSMKRTYRRAVGDFPP
jgi:hypothetical protein